MHKANKEVERRLDKKMDEKLFNVPGYEPYSISQALGYGR